MGPTPRDEIGQIVAQLAGSTVTTTPQAPPVFDGAAAERDAVAEPALGGPLKIAVAGPMTDGRTTEFARSITSMAAKHRVAGRAVDQSAADRSSSLAELLPAQSPFNEGTTAASAINAWLVDVTRAGADIVVLDYATTADSPSQRVGVRATRGARAGHRNGARSRRRRGRCPSPGAGGSDRRVRLHQRRHRPLAPCPTPARPACGAGLNLCRARVRAAVRLGATCRSSGVWLQFGSGRLADRAEWVAARAESTCGSIGVGAGSRSDPDAAAVVGATERPVGGVDEGLAPRVEQDARPHHRHGVSE